MPDIRPPEPDRTPPSGRPRPDTRMSPTTNRCRSKPAPTRPELSLALPAANRTSCSSFGGGRQHDCGMGGQGQSRAVDPDPRPGGQQNRPGHPVETDGPGHVGEVDGDPNPGTVHHQPPFVIVVADDV